MEEAIQGWGDNFQTEVNRRVWPKIKGVKILSVYMCPNWAPAGKIICFGKGQHSQGGIILVVVCLWSRVQLFATPWTAAHQASLSFTISWNLLKFMSIQFVVPSYHLILCCPLLFAFNLPQYLPIILVEANNNNYMHFMSSCPVLFFPFSRLTKAEIAM